jgi:hypothetical protein
MEKVVTTEYEFSTNLLVQVDVEEEAQANFVPHRLSGSLFEWRERKMLH